MSSANIGTTVCICVFSLVRASSNSGPGSPSPDWYKEFVVEADSEVLEHSGKMVLLFEILRMAEEVEDKVWVKFCHSSIRSEFIVFSVISSFMWWSCVLRLVFSQSLISLDLIEDFLELAGRAKEEGKLSPYKGETCWYLVNYCTFNSIFPQPWAHCFTNSFVFGVSLTFFCHSKSACFSFSFREYVLLQLMRVYCIYCFAQCTSF